MQDLFSDVGQSLPPDQWVIVFQLLSQQANTWVMTEKEKSRQAVTEKYNQASMLITESGEGGGTGASGAGGELVGDPNAADSDDDDDDDLFNLDVDSDELKNSLFSDVSSWMQTHFTAPPAPSTGRK